jgi:hypothetical protein
MLELNKYQASGMIDLDLYLAATQYFQREIQTQTHPWQVKTFLLLVEPCRFNWLNETFSGRGRGRGRGSGRGRRRSIVFFCVVIFFLINFLKN